LWGGLLLLVGLLGGVAVGVGWVLARQPRLPDVEPVPLTDLNPVGANFFLDREVEHWKQEKTLEMAAAAGIGWMKQQFSWEEIEPLQKGEYDWAKYDRIVDLAQQYGMQLIARLDRPPDWTRSGSTIKTQPPDDLADYGDFVYAFVDRYRGRVGYIQIWNEPNLTAEWGFQRVDAVAYTRLLEVAYRRAKEADPNVIVLSAPLAITLEDASMRGNHNDLVFLEQMYEAGAGPSFDVLSANAFGLDRTPEDPPAPDVLNFRRTELHREIMERHGDGGKPLWINEYGWNAAPESFAEELLTWERVSPEEQADYTVRGIAWARENWPWLGVVNIWYFRQVGNVPPDRAAYYFALVDPEFNAQPVYHAVRQASQAIGRAGLGLHQETSAAVTARGWQSVLDAEASAGAILVGAPGVDPLTFEFGGTGVSLVTARDADQGRALVEIDGAPAEGLPVDGQGRSYVDLAGGSARKQDTVTLARGLEEGAHRLTLVPGDSGQVTVDALLVTEEPGALPFYALGALCAFLVVAGVALWVTGRGRTSEGRHPAS
jgi:hypothetical protein